MFAYNVANVKVALAGELLWLVTFEDEVLIQPPGTRVSNHADLAKQMKGRDWTRAKIMAGEPLGFGGTILGGKLTYSGLMGSEGNVPKAYDPHGSVVGANRVQAAMSKVFAQAEQMGIPVDPAYSLNAVVPGRGAVPHERFLMGRLGMRGAFFHEQKGDDINFTADFQGDQYVADGDDGERYWILESGVVQDEQGNPVGEFDAFVDSTAREPDDDRDLDWYPEWHGSKVAGSPDAGFENWQCEQCGSRGADGIYEDPEGGYECRQCGKAVTSSTKEAVSWTGLGPDEFQDPTPTGPSVAGTPGFPVPCPNCGGDNVHTLANGTGECPNCGTTGIPDPWDQPKGPRVDDHNFKGFPFGGPSSPSRWAMLEKKSASFEYAAAPMGIHGRTGEVMGMLGLSATVTLPPNEEYPEGLVAEIPGQAMDIAWWGIDYVNWQEQGIVVQVETEADPIVVSAIFDELGGRTSANFDQLPPEVQAAINSMTGGTKGAKIGGPDALVCPKCGSHTIRAYDAGDENNVRCLTCGNEFHRDVMRNPEAKWKVEAMRGYFETTGNQWVSALSNKAALAAGIDIRRDEKAFNEFDQWLTHKWYMRELSVEPREVTHPSQERSYSMPTDEEAMRVAEMWLAERGGGGSVDPTQIPGYTPDNAPGDLYLPWGEDEQEYYRSAKTAAGYGFDGEGAEDFMELEDGGMDEEAEIRHIQKMVNDGMWRLQGSYGREMMRAIENGLVALGPDPAWDYYGNRIPSRFEVQPGTKGSVEFVNENSPYGVLDPKSVDAPGDTTIGDMGVPPEGEDYYRGAKMAAEGKFNPGQRVQIEHSSHRGQRGTIVEYTGKHEDFDEEQYKVLLDSGEELENVNESFFKKIKSAKKMTNADLPDSTKHYSFETMSFGMEAEDMDIASCPACEGPGMLLGTLGTRVHYRCRNCGLDFSHAEEPEVPMDVMPPEPMPEPAMPAAPQPQGPVAPGMPQQPMAHTAKWNDSNGQPLSAGAWYRMHRKDYKVPDVVRILNLEDNRIEAAIDTDVKGAFPIIISDNHEYSFEPITAKTSTVDLERVMDAVQADDGTGFCHACGSEAYGVEPDARGYTCENCGENAVFGAEESLMMLAKRKKSEFLSDSWLDDVPEWDGEPQEFNPSRNNTFTPGDRVSTGSAEGIVEGVEEGAYGAIYQVRFQDGQVQAVGGNALQLVDPNTSMVPDTLPFGDEEQEYYRSASNWRIARKKFSPAEQRALIEENPDGWARNMDKLDLSGTHYELKDASLDPDFLWGM